jgi:hypothetical protein
MPQKFLSSSVNDFVKTLLICPFQTVSLQTMAAATNCYTYVGHADSKCQANDFYLVMNAGASGVCTEMVTTKNAM